MTLEDHVRHHVKAYYAEHCGASLGYCEMPDGYALIRADSGYFYWLRRDGHYDGALYVAPISAKDMAIADKENGK